MLAPVRGHTGRHQAQNPLIPLSDFPEPPLNAKTPSGTPAPRTSIASTGLLSSEISASVKVVSAVLAFSSMSAICVVPGIGTIQGFWASSYAR